ncbi:MAG: serine protease [Planctomycetota bacterium]|nr:serine protease [Planctomycetota bacterium]
MKTSAASTACFILVGLLAWPASAADSVVASAYAVTAPATVVVQCGRGHGTGFVVHPDGWILTNHHVIADAPVDAKTATRVADVFFGKLDDNGYMRLLEEPISAVVYKIDVDQDLALLKVSARPKTLPRLPSLSLAQKSPLPGSPCVVIGHPAAGMPWTVRSGEVANSGFWPDDRIDVVTRRLTAIRRTPSEGATRVHNQPKRRVVISSCGLNPGDSGSALVNRQGQVIGVSFAIPTRDSSRGISLDKFSYHVHLEEVRRFLKDRPKSPLLSIPEAWIAGAGLREMDLDGDGTVDAVGFVDGPDGKLVGMALDLDGDSPTKKRSGLYSSGPGADTFDFEFVVQFTPIPRAFYDCDHDGEIDLILSDFNADGIADQELRKSKQVWTVTSDVKTKLHQSDRLKTKSIAERLAELLPKLEAARSIEREVPKETERESVPKKRGGLF